MTNSINGGTLGSGSLHPYLSSYFGATSGTGSTTCGPTSSAETQPYGALTRACTITGSPASFYSSKTTGVNTKLSGDPSCGTTCSPGKVSTTGGGTVSASISWESGRSLKLL